jgi:hypothetical protein
VFIHLAYLSIVPANLDTLVAALVSLLEEGGNSSSLMPLISSLPSSFEALLGHVEPRELLLDIPEEKKVCQRKVR